MAEPAPATFVTPATPNKSTTNPSTNAPEQRNALNDGGNLPPSDFTEYLPTNLPTPPFIFVPGIPNFRDIGGYACPPPPNIHNSLVINTSGTAPRFQVRRGLLFRCAHPTQLTSTGLMTLDALGITDFFDLRSAPELAKLSTAEQDPDTPFLQPGGHIELPGITRHFTPVYQAEDYGPVALAKKLQWYTSAQNPDADYSEGFVNAYRDIGTFGAKGGSYAKILRQILRSLAAEEQREKEEAELIQAKDQTSRRPGRGAVRPVSVYADLNGILGHMERYPSPAPGAQGKDTTLQPAAAPAAPKMVQTTKQVDDGGDAVRMDGGVVFHCTAGKDRTGVLAAVILYLVGVDMEDIAWEYAITEPGLGSWRRMFIDRISKQGMGSGQSGKAPPSPPESSPESLAEDVQEVKQAPPASAGGVGGAQKDALSRAEAARICGSRAGNIRRFITQVLEGEWGGVEAYLKGMIGLSDEEVESLRTGLVVRVDDEEGEEAMIRRVGIEGWSLEGGMDEDREL